MPQDGDLICTYASLDGGNSESFVIDLVDATPGVHTVVGSVSASNDANSGNNIDSDSMIVKAPEVDTTAGSDDGSATTVGETDGSSTDGQSDSAGTDGETDSQGSTTGSDSAGTDAGASDAGATSGGSTTDAGSSDSTDSQDGAGALSAWLGFALLLLLSARGYRRHQRQ